MQTEQEEKYSELASLLQRSKYGQYSWSFTLDVNTFSL